jgi:hypothetical protein
MDEASDVPDSNSVLESKSVKLESICQVTFNGESPVLSHRVRFAPVIVELCESVNESEVGVPHPLAV